jgi:hypothetical protein
MPSKTITAPKPITHLGLEAHTMSCGPEFDRRITRCHPQYIRFHSDTFWKDIETSPGNYDWNRMDRMVINETTRGCKIIYSFFCRPNWVDPLDFAAHAEFISQVVRRYPKLWAIQCWNEIWDNGIHTATMPNPYIENYAKLVKACRDVIKKEAPKIRLHGLNFTNICNYIAGKEYLHGKELGIVKMLDCVDLHDYDCGPGTTGLGGYDPEKDTPDIGGSCTVLSIPHKIAAIRQQIGNGIDIAIDEFGIFNERTAAFCAREYVKRGARFIIPHVAMFGIPANSPQPWLYGWDNATNLPLPKTEAFVESISSTKSSKRVIDPP